MLFTSKVQSIGEFFMSLIPIGRVANAIRVAAHTPRVAQVLFGFIVATQRSEVSGSLTKKIKALVGLKTSLLNGCNY